MDYRDIISKTQLILNNNPEWRERYKGYAKQILDRTDFIREVKGRFHKWEPLKFYLNVGEAKKGGETIEISVRYRGQRVAKLFGGRERLTISTVSTNERDFGCNIELDKCDWDGAEAREFRSFFKNEVPIRSGSSGKNNEEHRIESLLLTEFEKDSSKDKALTGIRPVLLEGLRFPMPTPFKASEKGMPTYAGHKGGGVDILARVGTGGRNTNLCIIEVKDENKASESADIVMAQAIKYTVFVHGLLRSEAGVDWWRLFGFGGDVPKKLTLFAACAMPDDGSDDAPFNGEEYAIDDDIIKLHYIYFKEKDNTIEENGIRASF